MEKVQPNKYSKIQYFFWLVSGSEISILKECPADFNRHASIGLTIFMTSLFGSFAGGYAGYYFSKDPNVNGFDAGALLPAVIFGIIWGLLVFSIDRSMVISLKKNPLLQKQAFTFPFISRAILGGLIAFIISIPLEIKIFDEAINANEKTYKESKILDLQLSKAKSSNIRSDSVEAAKYQKVVTESESNIKMDEPPTSEYTQAKYDYNISLGKQNQLKNEFDKANSKANIYLQNSVPTITSSNNEIVKDRNSPEFIYYRSSLQLEADKRGNLYRNQVRKTDSLQQLLVKLKLNWKKVNQDKLQDANSAALEAQKKESEKRKKIDTAVNELSDVLKFQSGFILRYEILSYAAYGDGRFKGDTSILFFVWLIRILFFVIEILPTAVKLTTPIGQYDWAVYRKEKDFVELYLPNKSKSLEGDLERAEKLKKENEAYKNLIEQELYKKTVDEIARIQNELALKIMQEYEARERNNIEQNIDKFLNNNLK
jgi:Domain of unknown function (DUF4407)